MRARKHDEVNRCSKYTEENYRGKRMEINAGILVFGAEDG